MGQGGWGVNRQPETGDSVSGCLCIVRQPENKISLFQAATVAKAATDGVSAARRHRANQ